MSVKLTVESNGGVLRTLEALKEAGKALDGTLATVSIDPHDPDSIERAVEDMKRAVDERLAPYASNSMVRKLGEQSKASFEKKLRERAEKASS